MKTIIAKFSEILKTEVTLPSFSGDQELEYFFQNLSSLLAAGIPVLAALEALSIDVRSNRMRRLIKTLEEDIDKGMPLWKSFQHVKLLPERLLSIVRLGEESGRLSQNLQIVVDQQLKDNEISGKLTSALVYPTFILILMSVVAGSITVFVLPRLATVYENLGIELPWATQLLISIGRFINENGLVVLPAVALGLLVFYYLFFVNPLLKPWIQKLIFNFPLVHRIFQEIELTRFGYVLGSMLDSGIPVVSALDFLRGASNFAPYQELYGYLQKKIELGESFQQALEAHPDKDKLMPPSIRQMLYSGEKTASLAKVLINIGKIYERKNERTTANFTVLLEPFMLVIVGLGVAFVAFGVVMPSYSLVGNIGVIQQQPLNAVQNETEVITTVTPQVSSPTTAMLTIKDTSTGYLSVRSGPDGKADTIARVLSGDVYPYLSTQNNWYEIELKDGTTGWVNGNYISLQN